ncbi:MAG: hypothetical protein ACLVJO_10460 [[Clostridium] scindens]
MSIWSIKTSNEINRINGMGFRMLLNAYRTKGQTFAQKMTPGKKKSPIIFDTAEFEKWRMKQLITENSSLYR